MNAEEYTENCLKTEAVLDQELPIEVNLLVELFHLSASVGLLTNLLKKKMFYGTPITRDDMKRALQGVKAHVEDVENELAIDENTAEQTKVSKRVLHGIIGNITETGELAEAGVKALLANGISDSLRVNILEEIGDGNWYDSPIIAELGSSLDEVYTRNINKLAVRYPNQVFSNASANNRDLDAEWKELLTVPAQPSENDE